MPVGIVRSSNTPSFDNQCKSELAESPHIANKRVETHAEQVAQFVRLKEMSVQWALRKAGLVTIS